MSTRGGLRCCLMINWHAEVSDEGRLGKFHLERDLLGAVSLVQDLGGHDGVCEAQRHRAGHFHAEHLHHLRGSDGDTALLLRKLLCFVESSKRCKNHQGNGSRCLPVDASSWSKCNIWKSVTHATGLDKKENSNCTASACRKSLEKKKNHCVPVARILPSGRNCLCVCLFVFVCACVCASGYIPFINMSHKQTILPTNESCRDKQLKANDQHFVHTFAESALLFCRGDTI